MLRIHHHEDVVCVEGILSRGGRESSIYVYLTDGMLIDTGPQIIQEDLVSFYHSASFDSVVLTHGHEDHAGTAAWIEQNRNVPIYIHEKGVDSLAQQADYPKYRQITWGIREPFHARPLGEVFQSRSLEWKVLHTPGHAYDHVALIHEGTGRLFSGDLFLGTRTTVILRDESIPVLMNSIRTVLAQDFQAMYCAHAGYIPDGKERLTKKLAHLENLTGEIWHLHHQGLSAVEIQERLFPANNPIIIVSEGEFDSLHIVTSVLAFPEQPSQTV
jgi:glyoxylase-like metal-dependent hydrolase (beta-lactamase superfamily II)